MIFSALVTPPVVAGVMVGRTFDPYPGRWGLNTRGRCLALRARFSAGRFALLLYASRAGLLLYPSRAALLP